MIGRLLKKKMLMREFVIYQEMEDTSHLFTLKTTSITQRCEKLTKLNSIILRTTHSQIQRMRDLKKMKEVIMLFIKEQLLG